jgi:hypothetical protein
MADTKATKKAAAEETPVVDPVLPEVAEGESVDGADRPPREQTDGHVQPGTGGADVGLATHDAHGGTVADTATVTVNPAEILAGVSAEQTEASLREHHTADSLEPGTNAELVPGLEARLWGHGPDAQHRFTGEHDSDVDSEQHSWMSANFPAQVCACGAVRAAPVS